MTFFHAIIAWAMVLFGSPEQGCEGGTPRAVDYEQVATRSQVITCAAPLGGQPIKNGGRPGAQGRGRGWGAGGFWHGIFNGI